MERTDIHGGQSPGEWSDQPENPKYPICGKKATHWGYLAIHPARDHPMNDAFPLCDVHWRVMWEDRVRAEREGNFMSEEEINAGLRKRGLL
jgi:hypothetical protein